ncbi:MAG: hypothetical protein HYZ53_22395 [Planctomycetes bacterium]|nr:hypothetical protein [Planctomycetota bacterium]
MSRLWPWIAILFSVAIGGASVFCTGVLNQEAAKFNRLSSEAGNRLSALQDQLNKAREYELLVRELKRRRAFLQNAVPPSVRFCGVLVDLANVLQDPSLGGKVFLRSLAYHDTVQSGNLSGSRDLVELHAGVAADTAEELFALRSALLKRLVHSPFFVEADPERAEEAPAPGQPYSLKVTCRLRRAKS